MASSGDPSSPRSEITHSTESSSNTPATSVTTSSASSKVLPKKDANTSQHIFSDSSSSKEQPTTADQLIQLTIDYIGAINSRSWDEAYKLQAYFHPAFITECRFTNREQTFLDSVETMREQAKLFPKYRAKLIEASGNIDEDGRAAHCFFHAEWLDCPPGIVTKVVYAIEWRHVDGMWLCYRTNVMPGVDEVV
ncbi:hypothetical protein HII31_11016 [Pseudocercospora fuligena]|uniref:Uncharacterized protein n=1 Tax=Pseudocercospora fuligena TaxID=685502 RepID=A0A8H6VEN0_9PEZI|nr:hypothetical protein HII31_11016 [Pseudocercospora fuligena]